MRNALLNQLDFAFLEGGKIKIMGSPLTLLNFLLTSKKLGGELTEIEVRIGTVSRSLYYSYLCKIDFFIPNNWKYPAGDDFYFTLKIPHPKHRKIRPFLLIPDGGSITKIWQQETGYPNPFAVTPF